MLAPTERFTSRVDDYVKFRPSYPTEVIDLLRSECGLEAGSKVADVGSGTGIFSRLLLDAGANVFAIEPNEAMRRAAEDWLGDQAAFHSVAGLSDATTLPEASVNLVTAAQAFHWFDRKAARIEFMRILKPGGYIALIWNERLETTDFLRGYEQLLRTHSLEYPRVRHQDIGREEINAFFAPGICHLSTFQNEQRLDLEGFLGRVMSSSYAPRDNPEFKAELQSLFDQHQQNGQVSFLYETQVFWGIGH